MAHGAKGSGRSVCLVPRRLLGFAHLCEPLMLHRATHATHAPHPPHATQRQYTRVNKKSCGVNSSGSVRASLVSLCHSLAARSLAHTSVNKEQSATQMREKVPFAGLRILLARLGVSFARLT